MPIGYRWPQRRGRTRGMSARAGAARGAAVGVARGEAFLEDRADAAAKAHEGHATLIGGGTAGGRTEAVAVGGRSVRTACEIGAPGHVVGRRSVGRRGRGGVTAR